MSFGTNTTLIERTANQRRLTNMSLRNLTAGLAAFLILLGSIPGLAAPPSELPNFHQVGPSIYRGAQPRPGQFAVLSKLGVRTVINLRSTADRVEKERRIVEGLGMRYVSIPLRGYQSPSDERIRAAIAELDSADRSGMPVFVHCRLGKDRTGTVIACFRMARKGWSAQQALMEAKTLGMSRRQKEMQRYIQNFATTADKAD